MKKCPTRIILWCVWHWFFKKNFLETICVGSEYIWWHDVCIKFQLEKSSKFSKRKKIRATDAARWEYLTTEFYISLFSLPCCTSYAQFEPKPSLKITTVSDLIYICIFRDWGLNISFRNKTFLFFKIESWNFQHLFKKEFREISQNFNSFSAFR